MEEILALLSLAGVAATAFFWFRRIEQVRIPENRTPFVLAALGSASLGLITLLGSPGWMATLPALIALSVGLLFTALVGISPQQTEGAIEVGDRLFDFVSKGSALDDSRNVVSLSSYAGTPVLFKFFRAHW